MRSSPQLLSHRAYQATGTPSMSSPTPKQRAGLFVGFLLISALVLTLGAISFLHVRDHLRIRVENQLTTIAEQKRQQIEQLLNYMANDATLFARGNSWIVQGIEKWLPELGKNEASNAAIRNRLEEIARARQYSMVALFGQDGKLLLAIGGQDAEAHSAQALRAVQSQLPTWVDLHRNADDTLEFGVLVPIQPEGQPPQGVLYVAKDAQRSLYPLVQRWPVPTATAETFLIRGEGHEVRFLSPLRHSTDAELSLTRPIDDPKLPGAAAARGYAGVFRGRDYRGTPVLTYIAPLTALNWSMIAKIDLKEADQGIPQIAGITAAVRC